MIDKLVVIEQKEVIFYEDELTAVRGADGQIYVAVTQMCRALGLDERSQRRRIQNHNILTEGYTRGDISTPPSPDGRGGGQQLEARLNAHDEQIVDQRQRLEAIESQLGAGHAITPDQATSISQAVKAVAGELGKRTGRNEYGGVYGELYRRYRIPSYRELPASKYDDAIKWLGAWFQDLTGEEPF